MNRRCSKGSQSDSARTTVDGCWLFNFELGGNGGVWSGTAGDGALALFIMSCAKQWPHLGKSQISALELESAWPIRPIRTDLDADPETDPL